MSIFFEFSALLGLVFQVLKVRFKNICKIEPPDLLLLVPFISFYISRYHFSQNFRNSFRIIRKKRFSSQIFFYNGFTQTPPPPTHTHPLNGQNPLSVTNVFCRCSLNVNIKEQNVNVYVDRETSAPDLGICRPDQEEIM